jgi:polyferredoxin
MQMPAIIDSGFRKTRVICAPWCRTILSLLVAPSALLAQYQKSPPDFGGTYSLPSPTHPEPASEYLRFLDVGLLALALVVSIWLVYKRRSRKGMILLSIGSIAYFGFFRKGCICAVGAIQNVVLCMVDSRYVMSISAIAIFFLPLIATLFFGRVFCSGVCPLGAIQDLVVLRPLRVPVKLDKALRWLQYVYLGLAILFAGWGLQLAVGSLNIDMKQRFLICDWDPFISIFRRTGPFYMVAIAAVFIVAGTFIGRPYCRWLCPYGGILAVLSRISWKNVRITPDKELNCGLCADSCAYGAIHELRADRGLCMACTRCYQDCPRQKRLMALRAGPRKPVSIVPVPRPWEGVTRTWTGIITALVVISSAVWLLTTYIHVRRVLPAELALADSLREEARMDSEVQNVLQPELERQQSAAVARRHVYDRGGTILLISGALFIAWFTWFRPEHGTGSGIPARFLKFVEKPPVRRSRKLRNQSNDSLTVT